VGGNECQPNQRHDAGMPSVDEGTDLDGAQVVAVRSMQNEWAEAECMPQAWRSARSEPLRQVWEWPLDGPGMRVSNGAAVDFGIQTGSIA
jgi:hypothetical protein